MTDTVLETKRAAAEAARKFAQEINEMLISTDAHPDGFEDFEECYGTVQEEDQHAHNLQIAVKAMVHRLEMFTRYLETAADGHERLIIAERGCFLSDEAAARSGATIVPDGTL